MRGSIYAIRSYKCNEVYIGSTKQLLCKRFASHKRNYKKYLNNSYHYISVYELLKYDDCYIELLENVEYEILAQLHAREGYYIRTMNCVNKCIMGRTKKQYIEDNKKYIEEYNKKNRERVKKMNEDNKEYIEQKKKID